MTGRDENKPTETVGWDLDRKQDTHSPLDLHQLKTSIKHKHHGPEATSARRTGSTMLHAPRLEVRADRADPSQAQSGGTGAGRTKNTWAT